MEPAPLSAESMVIELSIRPRGPKNAVYADPAFLGLVLLEQMHGDIAIVPRTESREGLANSDKILTSLPWVAFLVSSSASLTCESPLDCQEVDGAESEFAQALEKMVITAHRRGKRVGRVAMGEEMIHRCTPYC